MLLVSCSKKANEKSLQSCERLMDAEIITEEECTFSRVFEFQGELYSVCECCNCNKISNAVACDGESLCPSDDPTENRECMDRFFMGAEFLFNIRDSL